MKTTTKPTSSEPGHEPNRLIVSRKYLLAYANGIDFGVPESVPVSSIAVRSILDSMTEAERVASALELHPTGMRQLYADFIKTQLPKHAKDFAEDVQNEFAFLAELLPAPITVCDACLVPLTQEELEDVDTDDGIRALAIKDSVARLFVFLRKGPMEDQGAKLRANLQSIQGGLARWNFWHDFRVALVPKGDESSIAEFLRTLPEDERIRRVKTVLKRLRGK
jgi:hypothetical protein